MQHASRLLFAAYLAAIVFASLAPPRQIAVMGGSDKWFHLAAYLGLAIVAWLALRSQQSFRWGLLALGLLGIALELLQGMIPGRHPSLFDGVANVAGLLLGGAAVLGIQKWVGRGEDP